MAGRYSEAPQLLCGSQQHLWIMHIPTLLPIRLCSTGELLLGKGVAEKVLVELHVELLSNGETDLQLLIAGSPAFRVT